MTYWTLPIADYHSFYHPETARVLEGWDKSATLKPCPAQLVPLAGEVTYEV